MVIYPMEIKVTIIIVVKMEGNYEIMYSLCLYINSTKGSRVKMYIFYEIKKLQQKYTFLYRK